MARRPSVTRTFIGQEFARAVRGGTLTDRKNAMSTYKAYATALQKTGIKGNVFMGTNTKQLVVRVTRNQIGRLSMFFYDPKTKNELPYFDRYPMIMPIEIYKDGFLGINFHYISPRQRAILMDAINDRVLKNTQMSPKQKLTMSYRIMKSLVGAPQYIPCIKRYLYSHLRSKIYVIEPDAWNMALFLPVERFEKAPKERVWKESLRKTKNYGAF